MKLKRYLTEGMMDEDKWDKKFDSIGSKYQRMYKKTITQMIKTGYNSGIYQDWDDISYYAMSNAGAEKLPNEKIYTMKFLKDYESSLDAILGQAKEDLQSNESMKSYRETGRGKQWNLIGTAGKMGLYQSISYGGHIRGSSSWGVDFGDGKLVTFADKPSIKHLIDREYPVPKGTPKVWKKYKE